VSHPTPDAFLVIGESVCLKNTAGLVVKITEIESKAAKVMKAEVTLVLIDDRIASSSKLNMGSSGINSLHIWILDSRSIDA
jgi:hypothetical protein